MKTEIKKITPELATEMLKKNGMNRPLSRRHVEILKHQMKSGQWMFDGTPIKFNGSGQLLDGQHRLTALIESECEFDFVVISGIPTESFSVMDTGKTRSAADAISIESIPNSMVVSDVSRSLLNFKSHSRLTRTSTNSSYISNAQVYNFALENHVLINKSYDFCKKFVRPILPKSKLVAFHILFSDKSALDADVFISKLCTGLDLELSNPIYILRQKLIADAVSKKKISTDIKYALIAKCWNMFRKNETGTTVQLPSSPEFNLL